MSIAVAVSKGGRTVVAADTQENFGDRKLAHTDHRVTKMLQAGSAYLATTGWGLYDNILEDYLSRVARPRFGTRRDVFSFFLRFWKELGRRYSLVNEQAHQDDPSPFADLDSSFLVVSGGGIFYVSGNLSVSEFERYYAVGSGSSYALGAMHVLYDTDLDAEDIARNGCAAAMTFDLYCGGEIEVREVASRRTRGKSRGKRSA
jgi:ATP-dependent protease HslVU (ClpYQ) peptidase subunit